MKARHGLLFAGLLFPAVCLADASNYNYVEGMYLKGDFSDFNVDGWGVRGKFELIDNVFIKGSYSDLGLDERIPGFDADARAYDIGVGYVFGRNPTASLYGAVSYVDGRLRTRFNGARFSDSEDGYALELGARMNLSPEAELRLSVSHTDLGGGDETTVPSAGLVYKFGPVIAGIAEYSRKSGDDLLGLGFRFYF